MGGIDGYAVVDMEEVPYFLANLKNAIVKADRKKERKKQMRKSKQTKLDPAKKGVRE
jgi:hypothetical protein